MSTRRDRGTALCLGHTAVTGRHAITLITEPWESETCESDHNAIVREVFNRVGDKWTLLVIRMLAAGPTRFTTLRRSVLGISQRMLTLTLRQLERDGLVSRAVFAEVPPRVEYALTPLGETLLPPVIALAGWAIDHEAQIRANREQFDAESD
ncbi:helix-turn-helix domain-containing protein [Salinibacterium metalliresistens]|uniref:winged helix-turn-helix transcriptional regulator n=1 Tax=Salinibacterium metalliresistens TaxID=3031321 RepID=UPI0030B812DB